MVPEALEQQLREHPAETKRRLMQMGEWRDAERVLRKAAGISFPR